MNRNGGTMRAFAIFALGLVVGVGVIVACSDDSPPDVDAGGTCECPDAEAPLADRLVRRTQMETIAAMDEGGLSADCADFEIVINGSCSSGGTMLLQDSGSVDGTFWGCSYRNDDVNPHDATATVLCLQPPK
jgi:hypothetical protein